MDRNLAYLNLQNFPCKALEWHLADKKICAFLVVANFAECNSARAITMRLSNPSRCRGASSSSLGGKLELGSFSASRMASSLFGPSH